MQAGISGIRVIATSTMQFLLELSLTEIKLGFDSGWSVYALETCREFLEAALAYIYENVNLLKYCEMFPTTNEQLKIGLIIYAWQTFSSILKCSAPHD